MPERNDYPAGVPCWVDTLQPNVDATREFYGELFGWAMEGPGKMHNGGEYYVATLNGRAVGGVGLKPSPDAPDAWVTYVRVDNVEEATSLAGTLNAEIAVPPTDALPAGRFSIIIDPSGALLALWEAAARKGASVVNENDTWAMSYLQTVDVQFAVDFYEGLFGWRAESFPSAGAGALIFRLPGYMGGVEKQPVPRDVVAALIPFTEDEVRAGAQPNWVVNFWVQDLNHVLDVAKRYEAEVLRGPFEAGPTRQATLRDPQGAVLTFTQNLLR